jgi:UDP-N-acetylmuramyl pentapeptide phosphotransferase/UDP-N-acetylglucosamine-1-phosphate transferase
MIEKNFIYFFLILILTIYLLSIFFVKKKILINFTGEIHQLFVQKNKSIPLIGGIVLFLTFSYIFLNEFDIILFFLLVLILGILVDLKILISPIKRIFLQFILVLCIVYYFNLHIADTKINIVNSFLNIKFVNICFVVFCILVLVNGSNFIDGLNGLLIGYFILASIFLNNINFFEFVGFNNYFKLVFFASLLLIYFYNIFNKLYLGDSGAYLISTFFSIFLIKFHFFNQNISPYYIILILWYPCFENLFSIIRKMKMRRSTIKPDSNHLHQVLYLFIKKKSNLKDVYVNNISSIIILSYNFFVFYLGSLNIYSNQFQIKILIFSVILYIFLYRYLIKFKLNN